MSFIQSGEKPCLKEVYPKFLTKRHTQTEDDSVHAATETASRKIEIETPREWVTVMKAARAKQPYRVETINHTFWQKFLSLMSSIRPGKVKGDPVVTDLKHIMYTKDAVFWICPEQIWQKTLHSASQNCRSKGIVRDNN